MIYPVNPPVNHDSNVLLEIILSQHLRVKTKNGSYQENN